MTMAASKALLFFFLSILLCPSSDASRWFNSVIQHDVVYPKNPVITIPPENSSPGVITVPSTLPISVNPSPLTGPSTNPPPTPFTGPSTYPPPTPLTNPVTTPSPKPVGQPPTTTNPSPANGGKGWCVAKSGVQQSALQGALDYACGSGKADCSVIQQGASCYNPNTLQNHASYAFNSYYQKNPVPTSCDFGGAAMLTNVNPSVGSCVYPTSSTSSSPPATTTPVSAIPPPTTTTPVSSIPPPMTTTPVSAIPPPATSTPGSAIPPPARSTPPPTTSSPISGTPTTPSSSGTTPSTSTPPTVLNSSSPTLGGFPTGFTDSPPPLFSTSPSTSTSLQPSIGGISALAFLITVKLVLGCQERY